LNETGGKEGKKSKSPEMPGAAEFLNENYPQHPFLGVIKLTNWLKEQGRPYVGKRFV